MVMPVGHRPRQCLALHLGGRMIWLLLNKTAKVGNCALMVMPEVAL
jgi:hypothetical protein